MITKVTRFSVLMLYQDLLQDVRVIWLCKIALNTRVKCIEKTMSWYIGCLKRISSEIFDLRQWFMVSRSLWICKNEILMLGTIIWQIQMIPLVRFFTF